MKLKVVVVPAFLAACLMALPIVSLAEDLLINPYDDWLECHDCHKWCHGYYVEPAIPPFSAQNGQEISADSGIMDLDGPTTLKGHVKFREDHKYIEADKAIIYRGGPHKQVERIEALGHVSLIEPGFRITGTRAEVLINKDIQTFENAEFRIYQRHGRGTAKHIALFGKSIMVLKNASYTTCSPYRSTWELQVQRVRFNTEKGRGRAQKARLMFYDVPVLYLPYVDFPIDNRRKTGFLTPYFGSEQGLPFYWNIAPNYDMTLTPKLIRERGGALDTKFRYLTAQSGGEFSLAWLPHDRVYEKFLQDSWSNPLSVPANDPRLQGLKDVSNRYSMRLKDNSSWSPHWRTQVDYQRVSDDNYFQQLANNLDSAGTTHLKQQATADFQSHYWNGFIKAENYQALHPYDGPITLDVYRRLPQISLQNSYSEIPYGLEWNINLDFSAFGHKRNPLTGEAYTTGQRWHMRPSLALPVISPSWFITPRVQLDVLSYSLDLSPQAKLLNAPRHPSRMLPLYDLDSGLIFERNLKVGAEPFVQTLEPRFYYLNVPYKDHSALPNFDTGILTFDYNQLFRDNRFSGLDRVGDTHQLTLGVTSRFLNRKQSTERFSASLGQVMYFKDRRITACNPAFDSSCVANELPEANSLRSKLVGLARYRMDEQWSAYGGSEWDPKFRHFARNAVDVQYHPRTSSVLNVGYQYLRQDPAKVLGQGSASIPLKQVSTAFAWQLGDSPWRAIGRWHFDLHLHRSNEIWAGMEHQGCCTAWRFALSRFLKPAPLNGDRHYQTGIFLQFVFKGFTGVGINQMSQAIEDAIPGYHWNDREF